MLDETAITRLRQSMTQLSAVLDQPLPPKPEQKSVCVGCSYRIMCWGLATEDEDT
jgi:CRISPR/Cas system-associated exonuclease Cas4 (RecB family)